MEHVILMFGLTMLITQAFAVNYFGACTSDSECPDENHECVKADPLCKVTVCLCKAGYTYNDQNKHCLEAINLGDACRNDDVCLPYMLSKCSDSTNTCQCDLGLNADDGECVTGDKRLSETCTKHGDCKGFNRFSTGNIHCDNGTCRCASGSVKDPIEEICQSHREGGQSCSWRRRCSSTYHCTQNATCQCGPNSYEKEISLAFPRSVFLSDSRSLVHVCVLDTANTNVDIGGECGGENTNDTRFANVCKSSLDCQMCSFAGQFVCVDNMKTSAGVVCDVHSVLLIIIAAMLMMKAF